jgi:hypothetical protein
MTPDELDGLDDEVHAAFLRLMQREADAITKASRRKP